MAKIDLTSVYTSDKEVSVLHLIKSLIDTIKDTNITKLYKHRITLNSDITYTLQFISNISNAVLTPDELYEFGCDNMISPKISIRAGIVGNPSSNWPITYISFNSVSNKYSAHYIGSSSVDETISFTAISDAVEEL